MEKEIIEVFALLPFLFYPLYIFGWFLDVFEGFSKSSIDIILAIVQIGTLIALIIYVIKTWQIASASKKSTEVSEEILKEMKESRDLEVAPYVVAYFDIPYGKHVIYFVIKNIGKSVAKNVKLAFQPPLENSKGGKINNISLLKDGIGSIPPGYEIRTFFDGVFSYFEMSELPLTYNVKISYSGGLRSDTRNIEQIMDLSAFKGLSFLDEKGIHELVKEVEKLVEHNNNIRQKLEKVADNLADGVWLKNPDLLITSLQLEPELWKSGALTKLIEFKTLWTSVYGGEDEKLVNPFLTDLKNKSAIIGSQLLIIASSAPFDFPSELVNHLVEIAVKLSELGRASFYMDGGESVNTFNTLGNGIITLIDETIEQLKIQSTTSDNSE
ncbi:MAG: hypothetical protein JW878_08140 [Methanomicrobia archaeon]|nr:hypothetical protein [Methanomicrobia archaeon]